MRKSGGLSQDLARYFEFMKNIDKVYSSCKEEESQYLEQDLIWRDGRAVERTALERRQG